MPFTDILIKKVDKKAQDGSWFVKFYVMNDAGTREEFLCYFVFLTEEQSKNDKEYMEQINEAFLAIQNRFAAEQRGDYGRLFSRERQERDTWACQFLNTPVTSARTTNARIALV